MSDRVRFDLGDDHVGVVTLDRPEKLNAMDRATFEGLREAAAVAAAEAAEGRCRAVLLIGAGRAFSAGLDIALFGEQAAGALPSDEWIDELQQAFTVYEDLPVPTVAAIRGVAIGAGCQLALACHLRVGAPDASLGLLEAKWALVPDLGGTVRLPRLVGLSRAIDLATSARQIDAATAHSWGLLDAVLPDEGFEEAARAYAARLAAGPTLAVGAIPGLMRNALAADRPSGLAAERQAQLACLASEDFQEAVRAAVERRDTNFSGR